jgi:hypothetical protein
MKISILTLSALLASAVHLNAQSNTQNPKPTKKTSQSAAKTKQTAKPKKEKTAIAKDSVKPINKNPDHYYCPPCGMG